MPEETASENDVTEGPLLRARFGGILEGRVQSRRNLEAAADAVRNLGVAETELEIEGGRYSLLFDDGIVAGERVTAERVGALVGRLEEFVRASGAPEAAESTVHLTEVFPQAVRETLFYVRDGKVQALSRVRPGNAGPELEKESAAAVALRHVGLLRGAIILVLLLVGFGLVAWQTGYLGRILSGSAGAVERDTGPFGDSLALTVDKSWGNFEVTIRRGPSYPATPEAVEQRKSEAKSIELRAAVEVLAQGGDVYVQLLARDETVLESESTDLRPLLTKPDGEVTVELPGRLRAHEVRLSLSEGKKK